VKGEWKWRTWTPANCEGKPQSLWVCRVCGAYAMASYQLIPVTCACGKRGVISDVGEITGQLVVWDEFAV